ncbi:MAG: ABC transporter permease [Proteobacteria bacterium]|nr:ABC transporter permease [Pseudomonadota bacterium]MBI3499809.1 ABC transporter permease [Pseudomonadota bacterium]
MIEADTTLVAIPETIQAPPPRWAFWRHATFRRLMHHQLFLSGSILFAIISLVAVFAPLITDADPNKLAMRLRFHAPDWDYPFGTDNLGRSQLSRVLYGARLSLAIGLGVVILNGVFGVLIGAISGFFRHLDDILMRISDALMAFPPLLLALGIAAALGPSSNTAVIALSAAYIPRTARIVRASVLVVREMEYVQAAQACGAKSLRIMWTHILPNCMAPLIVQLTFIFAYAVLTEATLSFLGLGAEPPTPTWGNIMAEGRTYLREAEWITLIPGIALAMTVLGLNLLGDGLRDVLDPRLKVQQG